jgi:hypothetical protein
LPKGLENGTYKEREGSKEMKANTKLVLAGICLGTSFRE